MNEKRIYELMSLAIAQIEAVGKNKDFKDQQGNKKWKFRGVDDAMAAANKVMSELGLCLSVYYDILKDDMLEANNKIFNKIMVNGQFEIFAPDGSSIKNQTIGLAYDYSDKAANKAMSLSLKYFLFQAFMIPTEEMDDGDKDNPEHPKIEKPHGDIKLFIEKCNQAKTLNDLEWLRKKSKEKSWTPEEIHQGEEEMLKIKSFIEAAAKENI